MIKQKFKQIETSKIFGNKNLKIENFKNWEFKIFSVKLFTKKFEKFGVRDFARIKIIAKNSINNEIRFFNFKDTIFKTFINSNNIKSFEDENYKNSIGEYLLNFLDNNVDYTTEHNFY